MTTAPDRHRTPSPARTRASTTASVTSRLRSASYKLIETDPPPGMWAATGTAASKAPSIAEIRRGSFGHAGWNEDAQLQEHQRRASVGEQEGRRFSLGRRTSSGLSQASLGGRKRTSSAGVGTEPFPSVTEEEMSRAPTGSAQREIWVAESGKSEPQEAITSLDRPPPVADHSESQKGRATSTVPLDNGYVPPPKLPWTTSTVIFLRTFWKWFCTPLGFFITIYGLNVVAWGGMLFLLLCNASPAMCHPTCNDINSPRRKWIEIDSQILNALFCVTGFGLIPWRFRDLWWLMVYRLGLRGQSQEARMVGLRRLAGIYRGWFRLPGSDRLNQMEMNGIKEEDNPAIPLPVEKRLEPPLTGVRAPPTAIWKLDFVIWCNVWNTFLQACLCGFMWGMNRYNRPSWATGLFIALACVVAGIGGIMMYKEGKKVKKVEGVPPKVAQTVEDIEKAQGVGVPMQKSAQTPV